MMLSRCSVAPAAACRSRTRVVVCRATHEQPRLALPHVAAAVAAASLLLSAPAWARVEAAAPALTYEEELQLLIQKRTGAEFSPSLTEVPGEQQMQQQVEREIIAEAVAEEQQVPLQEAVKIDESAVKKQALKEAATVQVVTAATTAAPVPTGQTGIIVLGGLATVGIAAAALSNQSGTAAESTTTTPAAASTEPASGVASASPISPAGQPPSA